MPDTVGLVDIDTVWDTDRVGVPLPAARRPDGDGLPDVLTERLLL